MPMLSHPPKLRSGWAGRRTPTLRPGCLRSEGLSAAVPRRAKIESGCTLGVRQQPLSIPCRSIELATIVPLIKHLSKTAQLANNIEERAAYVEGIAHIYDGMEAFNRAILDSMRPFTELEASVRQAIESMTAPVFLPNVLTLTPRAPDLDRLEAEALARSEFALADAPLLSSRPKRQVILRVREKSLTRAELEDGLKGLEASLLAKLQGPQSGVVVAGTLQLTPPIPDENGHTWNDVFDWFYWKAPRGYCPTLENLARMVFRTYKHVQRMHSEYLDQHPELATRKKRSN